VTLFKVACQLKLDEQAILSHLAGYVSTP